MASRPGHPFYLPLSEETEADHAGGRDGVSPCRREAPGERHPMKDPDAGEETQQADPRPARAAPLPAFAVEKRAHRAHRARFLVGHFFVHGGPPFEETLRLLVPFRRSMRARRCAEPTPGSAHE